MDDMSDETMSCRECDFTATKQACPQCNTSFVCDLAQGKEHCWCMKLPAVMPVCSGAKCLCENCLRSAIDAQKQQPSS
jgi:hypothetical protein